METAKEALWLRCVETRYLLAQCVGGFDVAVEMISLVSFKVKSTVNPRSCEGYYDLWEWLIKCLEKWLLHGAAGKLPINRLTLLTSCAEWQAAIGDKWRGWAIYKKGIYLRYFILLSRFWRQWCRCRISELSPMNRRNVSSNLTAHLQWNPIF